MAMVDSGLATRGSYAPGGPILPLQQIRTLAHVRPLNGVSWPLGRKAENTQVREKVRDGPLSARFPTLWNNEHNFLSYLFKRAPKVKR
jgi:hypothetical protein